MWIGSVGFNSEVNREIETKHDVRMWIWDMTGASEGVAKREITYKGA